MRHPILAAEVDSTPDFQYHSYMSLRKKLSKERNKKKFIYSRETIYKKMAAVKSKDTIPERLLGKAMWKLGLRYRKCYKIKGTPDFVFVKHKIAVFCDGDFWHGNGWRIRGFKNRKEEQATYSRFWANKVRENIQRDKAVNKYLRKNGWVVIRFWESQIKKSSTACGARIVKVYKKKSIIPS
jgi:DNA mismatch endonuclease (patch repair protein)